MQKRWEWFQTKNAAIVKYIRMQWLINPQAMIVNIQKCSDVNGEETFFLNLSVQEGVQVF